ncbi:MAG: formyltransferase family protein [SAR202 cluster bacterium]|nr:formyltransferase family protein [SAR202 cluster bacterium]
MVYLFCAYRDWALKLFQKLKKKYPDMYLLSSPKKLTINYLKRKKPEIIFFPDWSWIIPNEIISNYKCICFHESNLPKFRGGSPIQNQIIRGITKTKTTAFIMNEKIDAGDIILQKDLSLEGSIQEIFSRMSENDYSLILKIMNGKYKRRKQSGKPTTYSRRKPKESELKSLNHSVNYLYNFIRMLEDPYPNAFIRIGKQKLIFKKAIYNNKKLSLEVKIE